MKKENKHLKEMEKHFESIMDSLPMDEKTIQLFTSLFIIASKVNDNTINKVAKDMDDFRKKECMDNAEWLKENGYMYEEDEIIYEGLFNFDE